MSVQPPLPPPTPLGSAPFPSEWPEEPADKHEVEDVAGAITDRIVGLLRQHTGRGPTESKAIISSDLVVITLADCLTTSERLLAAAGHGELVLPTRDLLLRGMRGEATAIVEELTHREVAAYLTDQQNDPDLAVIVFLLAPFRLRAA